MNRPALLWLKMPFFVFLLNSCISFDFDSLKDQKARGVIFQAPPPPYKQVTKKGMDFAWEHPKTGNTLSFFSNCSSAVEFTSLKPLKKDLLDGLKGFHLLSQSAGSHQGLPARRLFLKQKARSLRQKMSVTVFLFKKENCFYTVSFLAVLSSKAYIPDRQKVFEDFVREFRAP